MRSSAFAPVAAHAGPDIEELAPQPLAGPSAFASAAAFAEPALKQFAGKGCPQETPEFPQVPHQDTVMEVCFKQTLQKILSDITGYTAGHGHVRLSAIPQH